MSFEMKIMLTKVCGRFILFSSFLILIHTMPAYEHGSVFNSTDKDAPNELKKNHEELRNKGCWQENSDVKCPFYVVNRQKGLKKDFINIFDFIRTRNVNTGIIETFHAKRHKEEKTKLRKEHLLSHPNDKELPFEEFKKVVNQLWQPLQEPHFEEACQNCRMVMSGYITGTLGKESEVRKALKTSIGSLLGTIGIEV